MLNKEVIKKLIGFGEEKDLSDWGLRQLGNHALKAIDLAEENELLKQELAAIKPTDPCEWCESWKAYLHKNCPTSWSNPWPVHFCPSCGRDLKDGE